MLKLSTPPHHQRKHTQSKQYLFKDNTHILNDTFKDKKNSEKEKGKKAKFILITSPPSTGTTFREKMLKSVANCTVSNSSPLALCAVVKTIAVKKV